MGGYHRDLGGTRHGFADLKAVLACASPPRSGDQIAGLAASDPERRMAARFLLAELPLTVFLDEAADAGALAALAPGLTPEMVAAVSKPMRNLDLIAAGLAPAAAARTAMWLIREAARLRISGIALKEDADGAVLAAGGAGLIHAAGDRAGPGREAPAG